MFTSLHAIDDQFYRYLLGEHFEVGTKQIQSHTGELFSCPVIFARASAQDYTETSEEKYPVLSVANATPQLIKEFYFPYDQYFSAFRDSDADGLVDTGTQYFAQVPLKFSYELSIACKSESHWDALKLYILRLFEQHGDAYLLFNKISLPLEGSLESLTTDVGVPVHYTFETEDAPRSDGIFETLFTVDITAWVELKEPKDFETIKELVITHTDVETLTNTEIE